MNNFICGNCKKEVKTIGNIGTHQRNHCPFCLWSKHVDEIVGDRKSICWGEMKPIALTFKKKRDNKKGELMLIHQCQNCKKISINRIAADDSIDIIQEVFQSSLQFGNEVIKALKSQNIEPAKEMDNEEIHAQLFGK